MISSFENYKLDCSYKYTKFQASIIILSLCPILQIKALINTNSIKRRKVGLTFIMFLNSILL